MNIYNTENKCYTEIIKISVCYCRVNIFYELDVEISYYFIECLLVYMEQIEE